MLVPNKIISLDDSCFYKAAVLASKLDADISITELYESEKKWFNDLADFIDALDLLFVLGMISLNQENGKIKVA